MAKDWDVIYPAKGRIPLVGGLNTKFDRHEIDDDESPDCQNVVFGDHTVETRGGTEKLNDTAVGSFVGEGLYTRHDSDNETQTMVAWFNGSAFTWDGSTFTTIASAQSVYTAGERVCSAEQENHIFFNNGAGQPYKWNGTDFTRHGVSVPQSAPTATTAPTGTNLTGDYQWKVTYVNSQAVEGDVGSATATWTGASEDARVTIPTAPASYGVAARRLYRTEAGGTEFKRVVEINDNSTTSYDDGVGDGSLGVTAPTDNGLPPAYSVITYSRNRLWMNDTTERNLVWYTNLADPFTVASTNFIRVGDNASDLVRAIAGYDTGMLIKCDNKPWYIHMPDDTPTNWQQVETKASYGTKSPFGWFRYNNKIMYAAHENGKFVGFSAMKGATTDPDATFGTISALGSLVKTDRIEADMFDVVESLQDRISAFVHKQKAYITVAKGSGSTENNRVYVFDFSVDNLFSRKRKEGVWIPWTGLNAEQFTELNGDLYYISSTANGFVYKMNTTTYSDDGAAIDSYFWTKNYSGLPVDHRITKDFRAFNIIFEKPGDYFMTVRYRTDSQTGVGTPTAISLNPGGSLYGTAIYGVDDYGGGQSEDRIEETLASTRGERIQFQFSNQNTAGQKFKIYGLQFIYNRKGRRR